MSTRQYTSAAACLIALLLSVGCATPTRTVSVVEPFDRAEAERLNAKGSNTVRGSGLIRQQGGGVVTCAGTPVHLIPATRYAAERVTAIYGSPNGGHSPLHAQKVLFQPDPPEYQQIRKNSLCDAQGFFTFDEVADGDFYAVTFVTWNVGGYVGMQGGSLARRVSVSGGVKREIVLTP